MLKNKYTMKPILLIIGTRPEGIKMAPVYFALRQAGIPTLLCSTSQHTQLLAEVYQTFNFKPDVELQVMQHNQDLFHLTQEILQKTKKVYQELQPELILVHGDTTTAMAASLSAFYEKIPVGHVEAGLRTHNMDNPFPEEMNRRFVSMTARYHFAPTHQAVKNLQKEKIARDYIFCTGNTVIDSLRIIRENIISNQITIDPVIQNIVNKTHNNKQQLVLVTAHRRESFNGGIEKILTAVKNFALCNADVLFVYPYHPNPHITHIVEFLQLNQVNNIFLCKPLMYKELVYILEHAHWIATDSGGIQEEAISLAKRVVVFRNYTERPEGVSQGLATLVGTDPQKILKAFQEKKTHASCNNITAQQIYGDGYAAEKIVGIIQKMIFEKKGVR